MKKKNKLITIFSVVFTIIIAFASKGLPFSKETHQTINESIAHKELRGRC
jgi:hypothetical protein